MKDLYIRKMSLIDSPPKDSYLNRLPVVRHLAEHGIEFHRQVTFFVGENGSGKSTLIEALAVSQGFNPEGGTKNFRFSTEDSHSELYYHLRVSRGAVYPRDGFFRGKLPGPGGKPVQRKGTVYPGRAGSGPVSPGNDPADPADG